MTFTLSPEKPLILGASGKVDLRVLGEPCLSGRHACLQVSADSIEVRRLPDAKNPIFFHGTPKEEFVVTPPDFFVIGTTHFRLLSGPSGEKRVPPESVGAEAPAPSAAFTLGADELRPRPSRHDRMCLLDLMELPDVLRTKGRAEFYAYACGLLRLSSGAKWVRVLTSDQGKHTILAEDASDDRSASKPMSQSLIEAAIREAPQPVTYCWTFPVTQAIQATASEGVDWAVSCAMPIPGEPPVLFYLAGTAESVGDFGLDTTSGARTFLRESARLAGLVADMIGRTMSLQKIETWQSRLTRFFPPKLVHKILEADARQALAPKIAEATVLFFDIRGFSLLTEGNLQRILEYEGELRRVLTAMTQCIHDHEGVVLRYMGDGILACWNVPYAVDNHVTLACTAALTMVERLSAVTPGWTCGIGLGCGDVVAGSLGSEQVFAYDILGAVANQSARVEGITKIVGVPILVTEAVAARVSTKTAMTRRVARFRPAGMEQTVDLYTMERASESVTDRTAAEERITTHTKGLEAFEAGEWEKAFHLLHPIVEKDAAARYVYKLALQGKPPRDWNGVIELSAK